MFFHSWSSDPPLHLGVVAIEKGAFGLPSTMVANLLTFKLRAYAKLNYLKWK